MKLEHDFDDASQHAGRAGRWKACADCSTVGWVTVQLDMERERCSSCQTAHRLWEDLLQEIAQEALPADEMEEAIATLGEHLPSCNPCTRLLDAYGG
jgi:hypothetical protein